MWVGDDVWCSVYLCVGIGCCGYGYSAAHEEEKERIYTSGYIQEVPQSSSSAKLGMFLESASCYQLDLVVNAVEQVSSVMKLAKSLD